MSYFFSLILVGTFGATNEINLPSYPGLRGMALGEESPGSGSAYPLAGAARSYFEFTSITILSLHQRVMNKYIFEMF